MHAGVFREMFGWSDVPCSGQNLTMMRSNVIFGKFSKVWVDKKIEIVCRKMKKKLQFSQNLHFCAHYGENKNDCKHCIYWGFASRGP